MTLRRFENEAKKVKQNQQAIQNKKKINFAYYLAEVFFTSHMRTLQNVIKIKSFWQRDSINFSISVKLSFLQSILVYD